MARPVYTSRFNIASGHEHHELPQQKDAESAEYAGKNDRSVRAQQSKLIRYNEVGHKRHLKRHQHRYYVHEEERLSKSKAQVGERVGGKGSYRDLSCNDG
ncbi:hypothetical protein D3C73_1381090 [compost metagenome]